MKLIIIDNCFVLKSEQDFMLFKTKHINQLIAEMIRRNFLFEEIEKALIDLDKHHNNIAYFGKVCKTFLFSTFKPIDQ